MDKTQNWKKSRRDKISNGQNPELQNSERTKSRMEKIGNWTKFRSGQNPEWTKSLIEQNPELNKIQNRINFKDRESQD